jgi:Ca2+-binding RTX toxin-like protein
MRPALAGLLATAALLAAAAPASASLTVTYDAATDTLFIAGSSAETTTVTELNASLNFEFPTRYQIDEPDTIVDPIPSRCDRTSTTRIVCEDSTEIDFIDVDLGASGDTFVLVPAASLAFRPGADLIVSGGTGDDEITTLDGDDDIDGGDGADTISSGAGVDTIDGDDGSADGAGDAGDDIDAGPGDDVAVDGNGGADEISGGDGNDTLDGEGGADQLNGDDGDDLLRGGPGNDILRGRSATAGADGNDTLEGGADSDSLRGNDGDDTLSGGSGDDATLDGGAGDDTIGGEAADCSSAGTGDDGLTGGPGADVLRGCSGDDVLDGGTEDDTLDGGPGCDGIAGGDGRDTVTYASRATGVTVRVDGAPGDGGAEDGALENVTEVERLIGGSGPDVLEGSAADDELIGGAGGDVLDGKSGSDSISYEASSSPVSVTIGAGAGDDGGADDGPAGARDTVLDVENVTGSAFGDFLAGDGDSGRLTGGAGDDTLRGGGGADVLEGGEGTDSADYSERSGGIVVVLDGAAGDGEAGENDTIAGDVENALGGAGADDLTGSAGANRLDGGAGNDRIVGLGSPDALLGGAGDDNLQARDGVAESVSCGEGTDSADADPEDQLDGCEGVTGRPPPDSDGDGSPDDQDCDDGNPAIRPGALEIVGNSVDENCDSIAAPFPLTGAGITSAYRSARAFTVMEALTVLRLPAGTRVQLTCKAPRGRRGACAFRRYTRTVKKRTARLRLVARFKRRRLPVRTKIELRVLPPNEIGKVLTITVKRGTATRRLRCMAPGARKPGRCPAS